MRLRTLGLQWTDVEQLMALRRERERLAEQQWWAYVRFVRRRWYEAERRQQQELYSNSRNILDCLLTLLVFLLTGTDPLPEPQLVYNELNCIALFGPPDKTLTEALQGLAYAREQDLQTPQEIEWKAAELRSVIRCARIDYDQSTLDAALEEWRKLQVLQTRILAMDYTAKWGQTREPEQER